MKYLVTVTETVVTEYLIEADSEDAAIQKAEDDNIEGVLRRATGNGYANRDCTAKELT